MAPTAAPAQTAQTRQKVTASSLVRVSIGAAGRGNRGLAPASLWAPFQSFLGCTLRTVAVGGGEVRLPLPRIVTFPACSSGKDVRVRRASYPGKARARWKHYLARCQSRRQGMMYLLPFLSRNNGPRRQQGQLH